MEARGEVAPTSADAPARPVPEWFWTAARVVRADDRGKTSIHLRVDADVLDWFRSRGKGHLTRMNAVLRAYMDAEKARAAAETPKAAAE